MSLPESDFHNVRAERRLSDRQVVVHPDAESLALAVATLFVEEARRAVRAHGRFTVALAGGSTPKEMYRLLARSPFADLVPWGDVHVFWGDERCVPSDDPLSNERLAREALLDHVPVPPGHIHPMRCSPAQMAGATAGHAEQRARAAAAAYDRLLRTYFPAEVQGEPESDPSPPPGDPTLDLVLLGLGVNGHTASLFPGSQALEDGERWAVPVFVDADSGVGTAAAGRDLWRVSLTASFINRARVVAFMVSGYAKAAIVAEVLLGPDDPGRVPAQLIKPRSGSLWWHLDGAAAARLMLDEPGAAVEKRARSRMDPSGSGAPSRATKEDR